MIQLGTHLFIHSVSSSCFVGRVLTLEGVRVALIWYIKSLYSISLYTRTPTVKYRFIEFFVFDQDSLPYSLSLFSVLGLLFF